MSKKNLLEESTIRKFMKFANLGHLAESFVDEAMYEDDMEADVLPPEAGEELEADMDLEEPVEEPVAGNEELLARVVQAVADELGVEAEVEGADAEEADLDMEPEMEEPEMEEPEMEPAEELMQEAEEEVVEEEVVEEEEEVVAEVIDEEAIIEEVMKRVIERVAAKK
jgi:hypothetical protein